MNKSELVDSIAEGAGLSKADAERALNALIESVQAAVAKRRQGHTSRFWFLLPLIARRPYWSQSADG